MVDVLVEFDYDAESKDELTISVGEILTNVKQMEGGWWQGTHPSGKRGLFPDNFVKVLSHSSAIQQNRKSESSLTSRKTSFGKPGINKRCRVLFSYEPTYEDELKLTLNDVIELYEEVEDGWWKGNVNGKTGVFPSNFVQMLPDDNEAAASAAANKMSIAEKNKKNRVKEYCLVQFPYTALKDDELTLYEGQIIRLITKDVEDRGWWKGEFNGKIGVFPDNFVKIVDETTAFKLSGKRSTFNDNYIPISTGNSTFPVNPIGEESRTIPIAASTPVNTFSLKKNSKESCSLDMELDKAEDLDVVLRNGSSLLHPTADRVKGPKRRPPSSIFLKESGINENINNNEANKSKENDVDDKVNDKDELPKNMDRRPMVIHEDSCDAKAWLGELIRKQADKKTGMYLEKPPLEIVESNKVVSSKSEKPFSDKPSIPIKPSQIRDEVRKLSSKRPTSLDSTMHDSSDKSGWNIRSGDEHSKKPDRCISSLEILQKPWVDEQSLKTPSNSIEQLNEEEPEFTIDEGASLLERVRHLEKVTMDLHAFYKIKLKSLQECLDKEIRERLLLSQELEAIKKEAF